jgi:beta-N-acetylhexosaminidase
MSINDFFKKTIVSINGTKLTKETTNWLLENKPMGIVLFKNNISTKKQIKQLISEIKSLYNPKPLISVDFEGGSVNRFNDITGYIKPPISQSDLREFGKISGGFLKDLDIDINFAPVVDIDTGIENNGLKGRYLGKSPSQIIDNATNYLEGLESIGITGCLKHYPGLGRLKPNTHLNLPEIENIREDEESIFKELTSEKRLIMVAHIFIKEFNEISTYSKKLIKRIKTFHKGQIITDDLSMNALKEKDENEKIKKTLQAGFDIALIRRGYCHKY